MAPPFFTASFIKASAAIVPCVPTRSNPISSNISATLSLIAFVGARERSMIPNGTFKRSATTRPINSPARVILKVVFLMISDTSPKSASGYFFNALKTTPGPLTPTFMTTSPSPAPWKAPAINGLSSTGLQKTTSLAQAKPF